MRSTDTTLPPAARSMASTARGRGPPRSTGRPSTSTSIGPSTRIHNMVGQ